MGTEGYAACQGRVVGEVPGKPEGHNLPEAKGKSISGWKGRSRMPGLEGRQALDAAPNSLCCWWGNKGLGCLMATGPERGGRGRLSEAGSGGGQRATGGGRHGV